jgi:hypothetical protein
MINIDIIKGKPKVITENIISNIQNNIIFIAEVKIEYLKEKYWFNKFFKLDNIYIIDNITYSDLINFQDAKINIIKGIYWDENNVSENDVNTENISNIIYNLLEKNIIRGMKMKLKI